MAKLTKETIKEEVVEQVEEVVTEEAPVQEEAVVEEFAPPLVVEEVTMPEFEVGELVEIQGFFVGMYNGIIGYVLKREGHLYTISAGNKKVAVTGEYLKRVG